MKNESEEKMNDEFVGLKSEVHSMKTIDGKESNNAEGVNIATVFNEFKDTLFNQGVLRHKMKRIQSKNINLEHTKSIKYHYRVLMLKYLF